MELLPQELRDQLPPHYATEGVDVDRKMVYAKLFSPDTEWTWFVVEGQELGDADEKDYLFFGFVIGFEEEWGYFSLAELESIRGPRPMPIERDLSFTPGPFAEVKARFDRERGR